MCLRGVELMALLLVLVVVWVMGAGYWVLMVRGGY
jgi:hypothetical protein